MDRCHRHAYRTVDDIIGALSSCNVAWTRMPCARLQSHPVCPDTQSHLGPSRLDEWLQCSCNLPPHASSNNGLERSTCLQPESRWSSRGRNSSAARISSGRPSVAMLLFYEEIEITCNNRLTLAKDMKAVQGSVKTRSQEKGQEARKGTLWRQGRTSLLRTENSQRNIRIYLQILIIVELRLQFTPLP